MDLVLPDSQHVRDVFADETDIRARYWRPRTGQVALDIGSYFGSYAIPALAAGASVIAVEPYPWYSGQMTDICAANGISTARLTVISEALAQPGGYAHDFWTALDSTPHGQIHATRTMPFTTIDKLAARLKLERLDWIKIDVEGAELGVLDGGRETLARFRPALLIEDHTDVYPFVAAMDSQRKCLDLLRSLGYDMEVVRYEGHRTPDRDFLVTPPVRDLGMLVPSRSRPHNAARLWDSMRATCTPGTTALIIGLDDDDPRRDDYPGGPGYVISGGLRYVTAWVNHLAVATLGEFSAVGHVGDDNTCDTPGWDARVLEALDKHLFTFANDLYPREPGSLSCHIFMRSDVVRTLGYMGPPEISHMFVDVAWMAWCIACGHEFLADVLLPHHHYTLGHAADDTYARSNARTASDLAAWHAYSRRQGPGGLNDDIAKLGGEPFTPERLARFNRDLNIPG